MGGTAKGFPNAIRCVWEAFDRDCLAVFHGPEDTLKQGWAWHPRQTSEFEIPGLLRISN
jgi:hypothetical protein